MKQAILDFAAQLTPYTTQIAYAGAIILFIGWLALFASVMRHRGTGLLRLPGRLLILLGVLFLAFQVAAFVLGLQRQTVARVPGSRSTTSLSWLVGLALLHSRIRPAHRGSRSADPLI